MENSPMKGFGTAVELLENDHEAVMELFDQYEDMNINDYEGKKKLADDICKLLTNHTTLEEEIFYPAVREWVEGTEDLIAESLVEHAAAKELISDLRGMSADDEMFDAKVKVLNEQINMHVEEEESQLFPDVRDSELDLAALGEKMANRRKELEM